jgi:hypothetical protein
MAEVQTSEVNEKLVSLEVWRFKFGNHCWAPQGPTTWISQELLLAYVTHKSVNESLDFLTIVTH